ncbi:hypothetical protein ACSU6B_00805 [Neobacillus sp. C211]|uniref:hypothetical protein n=1 Tax=unclassified Neobacillus TaxID=2675272 RepID=UPI003979A466
MTHSNKTINDRRKEVGELAANKALEIPILPSGYWFHHDLRDNFYYAIHLFAYCVDKELANNWSEEKREHAKKIALDMIRKVLSLQMKDFHDPMYGHWPLNLGNHPCEAKPNPLTVELLGCLLTLFYTKYQHELPSEVSNECYLAIQHMYKSSVYCHPLKYNVHHGAKHASLKLLLGHFFNDNELMKQGLHFAKQQFNHIQQFGFKEYGPLPWFWHWIQAFTCVWEVVENSKVRNVMNEMLDHLWRLRAENYLKGTWVGPHSRQSAHDVPKDHNTLLDYIQFGDFPFPSQIVRLEGSVLFTYEVSDKIVQHAISRTEPVEIKRKIQAANVDGFVTEEMHTYVFIDPAYAVGGIWERINEYDNEQQLWDITLPLSQTNAENSVNQAFFFHPGEKYVPGDDRHASPFGEVLYHKGTVIQMWHIPKEEKDVYSELIGCLPVGEWYFEKTCGYGRVESTYLTFQLINEYNIEKKADRISISSPFISNWNGVIIEAVSCKEAEMKGIQDLESFIAAVKERKHSHSFFTNQSLSNGTIEKILVSYTTCQNDQLTFSLDNQSRCERVINHHVLSFNDYQI